MSHIEAFIDYSRQGVSRDPACDEDWVLMPFLRRHHSNHCFAQELAAARRVSMRELPRRELRVRGAAAQQLHAAGICFSADTTADRGWRGHRYCCCGWCGCDRRGDQSISKGTASCKLVTPAHEALKMASGYREQGP